VWWYTPIISVLRQQRQENHKFKANLGYNSKILSQKTKIKIIISKMQTQFTLLAAILSKYFSFLSEHYPVTSLDNSPASIVDPNE
jgi:hypothetical protein